MADQQNFDPPQQDHLDVARNLIDRGNVAESAVALAQVNVLIDIAESLRHLRPEIAVQEAPSPPHHDPAIVAIFEEDWNAVYQAGMQAVDEGMYFPTDLLASLRAALEI